MMKRLLAVYTACMLLLVSCSMQGVKAPDNTGKPAENTVNSTNKANTTNSENITAATNEQNKTGTTGVKNVDNALTKLLPEKTGFKWVYHGFAEYAHTMTLEKVEAASNGTVYSIKGNVADMSGGGSKFGKSHFDIDITYKIAGGILTQIKKEEAMMDSNYDTLELIRLPLTKGSKWTQKQKDKSGTLKEITSEITGIEQRNGKNIYTVLYLEKGSSHYEKREIMEGYGTIRFIKQWIDEGGNKYELNYSLYLEGSGYKK